MLKSLQAIRGMNDILPTQIQYWQYIENTLREIAHSYGYQEIRFPLVEHTELFARTIGEVTDIVSKEMYTFTDRNGDNLTLRPEGTAGCARAGIQQGLLYNQIQRLWYMGPMFRHERPQKGRYRQFHQFGVEVFGILSPDIDAELILMLAQLWQKLHIQDQVSLQINSLGDQQTRTAHRQELVKYFEKNHQLLDEDSRNRLQNNPLRILDSKNPSMQAVINNAPQLLDHLDAAAKQHFATLQRFLDTAQITYTINPHLVRGLDYYNRTVFEWVTKQHTGAQNTVCAGGRYDNLVAQTGGKPTPAIGFAMGLERLIELISAKISLTDESDIYLIMVSEPAIQHGLLLAEKIRSELPHLRIITNCGGGSFKAQFKRADKSNAKLALILGDEEIANNIVGIKYLREDKPQQTIKIDDLLSFLIGLKSLY